MSSNKPWVSFCISTYRRPELLKQQLQLLLSQTFPDFHIVISDNDPKGSAKSVCEFFNDSRIKYFHNGENLGMIKSFNKSIERSETDYIVMVTDDDPVEPGFLNYFHKIHRQYSQYSIYCGFLRYGHQPEEIEFIPKESFISEILDPKKTLNILWSSSIIKREDALKAGSIPDYGSPHLADHAFLALTGNIKGGIIVNKMFSSLTSHNTNFSKSHFESYLSGCKGFYAVFSGLNHANTSQIMRAVLKHLRFWFISCFFTLKKYYTINKPDAILLKQIDVFAHEILELKFMRKFKMKFQVKDFFFRIKKIIGLLS